MKVEFRADVVLQIGGLSIPVVSATIESEPCDYVLPFDLEPAGATIEIDESIARRLCWQYDYKTWINVN